MVSKKASAATRTKLGDKLIKKAAKVKAAAKEATADAPPSAAAPARAASPVDAAPGTSDADRGRVVYVG